MKIPSISLHQCAACFMSFLVLASGSQQALSAYIVDTGQGGSINRDYGGSANQWLAGEFAIASDYTITGVEGWISEAFGETGTIAIYTDGGDLPGSELFSEAFTGSSDIATWQGISGVSWDLLAGTYWVSFERRTSQSMNGRMPSGNPPSPLGNEAYKNTFTGNNWTAGDGTNINVRIAAVESVPVPAAVWLFGSGFLGLIGIARRKKAA